MALSHFYGGCYDAGRAAALSGVPKSTVYDWARKRVVVPSVSPTQEKLWSYADLMSLRVVSWLRHRKSSADAGMIPASPMSSVRLALDALAIEGMMTWSREGGSPLVVEASGRVLIRVGSELRDPTTGDMALPDALHSFGLTGPFGFEGQRGPDLIEPRPHLRIVPGKVAGEPHVAGTRVTTLALASLLAEAYGVEQVARMYDLPPSVVRESAELEAQLGTFASVAA